MANVTIKDIAKHADVSIATVSRVINDSGNVADDKKDRILESIKELKYFPNTIARSLKREETMLIGFLVSDIGNNYFTAVAKALENCLHAERYNLIVCSTEMDAERELNYLNLLMGKKIDALVINTTGMNDTILAEISHRIPVVLINRKVNHAEFTGDFIDSNNFEGGYLLAKHLIENGHKRIAMINGNTRLSTAKERRDGALSALDHYGIVVPDTFFYEGDFNEMTGYNGVSELISLAEPPTGIIAMNNMIAVGALKYLKANQIPVPSQIALSAYGNIQDIELFYVKPTYVTLNPNRIGEKSGEILLERIKGVVNNNREIIYTPQLIVGD